MSHVVNRSLLTLRRLTINLVTYPEGHSVMRHNDPIGSGSYYKFNVVLKKPLEGGVFETDNVIFSFFDRIVLFRPDLNEHNVTRIERGRRVLLSVAFHAPWG